MNTKDSASSQKSGFNFESLGDILKKPDTAVNWQIENIALVGGVSLVAGKPKTGKTTFAKNAALAVARGEPFLGFQARCAPVLYLALEDHMDELRRDFRNLGAQEGDQILVHVATAPPSPVQALKDAIAEFTPGLVVIDTLFKFARVKDLNNYAEINERLEPILSMARTTHTHIMAIHHAKKGLSSDGDSVLGSTAIYGMVDTLIVIDKTKHYRTVSTTVRFGSPLEPSVLEMDISTKRLRLAGTKEQATLVYYEERIRKFLHGAAGDYFTEPEIKDEISAKTERFKRALRALVKVGSVKRTGGGKKNDPYKYGVEPIKIVVPSAYKKEGNYNNILDTEPSDCGSQFPPAQSSPSRNGNSDE